MPWSVERSDRCPADRPWGVINQQSGAVEGCHPDEDMAKRQQAALYANASPEERAQWDTAFVNNLPDSSFAYVAPGGSKDSDGKTTPRSLRYLPYKDASGKVDLAHLRNALARLDQTGIPADAKAKARSKLEAAAREAGVGNRHAERWEAETPEMRSMQFSDVETRDEGLTFAGYAAIYDEVTDLGDFTESVTRGAFRKVVASSDNVPMLWDHSPFHPPLATTRGGTLKLTEDPHGLRVEATLDPAHYLTPTIQSMLNRGDVRGMSFGFVAGKGNSRIEHRGNKPHRELLGFKRLLDVSPTWDPAYSSTTAEMRSLRALQMAEDLEAAQQILMGAHQQPEDGVQPPGDVDADESHAPATEEPVEEEQRSGVEAAKAAAAARRRRLRMMGMSLPKEPGS